MRDSANPLANDHAAATERASGIGLRYALAVVAVALLALVALAVYGHVVGVRSRWSPPDAPVVVSVDAAPGALREWQDAGVSNAVLVVASRQLGFQTVPFGAEVTVPSAYPVDLFDVRTAFIEKADRSNRIWVASQVGMFRTVHYVLTEAQFTERVAQGRSIGAVGIAPDGSRITPNNNGYLRHIAPSVPSLSEPAVLLVDASYFEDAEPSGLIAALSDSGTEFALVTIDRSLDDTATSDIARERLAEFQRLLESR